jgi:SAM-dependent methyltransferase
LQRLLIVCALLAAGCAAATGGVAEPAARPAHPRYEPTSMDVVQAMLRLAGTTSADVVYDLGCGDGRIVIMAASRFGARGVCVDIDPERIAESRANARAAGVADRIRFLNEDLLTTDLGGAPGVTLYLSNELNLALRSKLQREPAGRARRLALARDGRLEAASVDRRAERVGRALPLPVDDSLTDDGDAQDRR